ncbi:MAG: aminomethyl-transferring glycine dehydrogenase subunit GcvPA [Promethearchaeota archaeon]
MDYTPHNRSTIETMLKVIGVNSIEDLYQDIPKDLLLGKLNLPEGLSEADLLQRLKKLSKKNALYSASFLGAGCYYHYIPAIVDSIISRSEFYTAYTPYQPEASQGMLQAIYEYQTVINRLTGLISNASMYDGSTALAEAAIVSTLITQKKKILIVKGIHPEYIEVLKTYCWGYGIEYKIVSLGELFSNIDNKISAILIQSPNFFGDIEDIEEIVKSVKEKSPKCLVIQSMTDPTCLGLLKAPGECNIDIFVAEGQSLGIKPSFGGPGLGIFAVKEKFFRKIPGRLVGKTLEIRGDKEGFILTLQAREQHIRREKAISNICTNQALCSLSALFYLVAMGKTGLAEVAKQNFQKADYLKNVLASLDGFQILNEGPTYNEFLVKCPDIEKLIEECKKNDLLPPLKISKYFPEMQNIALVCVTEMNSTKSIEKFINIAKSTITGGYN